MSRSVKDLARCYGASVVGIATIEQGILIEGGLYA